MTRVGVVCAAIALVCASCGGGVSSCSDYAAELEERVAVADSAQEVLDWIDGTSDDVARLIRRSATDGQVCVEAILEAMFAAGFKELEAELDLQLSD